jgi:hypothetical protein
MSGAPLIALMGFICMATLFIGLGFVFPVSSAVGDLFDFLAVASGMFVIGLLDDGYRRLFVLLRQEGEPQPLRLFRPRLPRPGDR